MVVGRAAKALGDYETASPVHDSTAWRSRYATHGLLGKRRPFAGSHIVKPNRGGQTGMPGMTHGWCSAWVSVQLNSAINWSQLSLPETPSTCLQVAWPRPLTYTTWHFLKAAIRSVTIINLSIDCTTCVTETDSLSCSFVSLQVVPLDDDATLPKKCVQPFMESPHLVVTQFVFCRRERKVYILFPSVLI